MIINVSLLKFEIHTNLLLKQGPWIHPEIDNPEYTPDSDLYYRKEICAIGLDLWQVKSGTIFGNLLVTDDPEEAKTAAEIVKEMQVIILSF